MLEMRTRECRVPCTFVICLATLIRKFAAKLINHRQQLALTAERKRNGAEGNNSRRFYIKLGDERIEVLGHVASS